MSRKQNRSLCVLSLVAGLFVASVLYRPEVRAICSDAVASSDRYSVTCIVSSTSSATPKFTAGSEDTIEVARLPSCSPAWLLKLGSGNNLEGLDIDRVSFGLSQILLSSDIVDNRPGRDVRMLASTGYMHRAGIVVGRYQQDVLGLTDDVDASPLGNFDGLHVYATNC